MSRRRCLTALRGGVSDGYQFSIHLNATSLLSLRLNARRRLYRRCRLTMAKQHWRQIKCAQTRIQSDRFAAYKDTFLDMTIHWLSPIRTSSEVERLAVSGRCLSTPGRRLTSFSCELYFKRGFTARKLAGPSIHGRLGMAVAMLSYAT